jgi:NADH-quinone oxidoreductase subunit M
MTLIWLIIWLTFGGLVAWLAGRWSKLWPRWISLFTLGVHLISLIVLWVRYPAELSSIGSSPWVMEFSTTWIPQWNVNFHLGLDGFSLLLLLLTNILGILAVATSWKEITYQVGFFHLNLLWILSALMGVFMALDLFLFYFFWEMMLVPLYFLIGIWGHEHRVYAALKFFLFTQASGLLMLISILGLYFVHGNNTGVYTFEYNQLIGTAMSPKIAFWLMMGFFMAFAVKLPMVPFHTWLPDAHTEAPTAGSVDLAGLVLKVGAYGFIRFLIPLFPEASFSIARIIMGLAVFGIIYGAILAFAQNNLKRLVAYTSVSHMGFVLLGIFSWNQLALQGVVMIMIAHGISTGGLFILVGQLYERMHTRDLNRMGGLWETVPRIGRVGTVLALASLGLPGLANFVGEFLVLLGAYKVDPIMAIIATLGFIVATVYSLWMIQRIFTGPNEEGWQLADFDRRELAIVSAIMAIVFWLGIYPQPVLQTSRRPMEIMQEYTNMPQQIKTHQVDDRFTKMEPTPIWIDAGYEQNEMEAQ